ncbi:type III-B CRISPR module RAMP protein Cmr1 [Paenibacillus sp. J5C_2022]|uniref:type III-B CRISPR module RAMP protein Cmr1 n=1 Tax=Paenibacillus sp. J5C2022 TaxID=2977129 RepID=UPI0021CE42A6|nr:type III-B CRISPR module RAMP protein Cmr1 [Paenibacillus sp. J5C2022]MCU6711410.1 type III-B CRISPR module RAMP protein Cmr1 [Paenibacillus sp. J5C2022]
MERSLVLPNEEEKQNIASILLKAARADDKSFTQEYTIHVVSPMIWGDEGSRESIIDDAPFRSTSIRGQLRFWWRATRGAAYDNTAELRKQETILFGDPDFPSPLKVVVKELEKRLLGGEEKKNYEYSRFSDLPRYVTFPFQESMREAVYGTFKLMITVPSDMKETYEQEICPAIWAWINFGGIGARTRRGCGSLYCQQFSPNENENIHAWYQHKASSYKLELPSIQTESKHEWPVLCSQLLCNPHKDSFNDAWKRVITVYKNFRRLPNPKPKKETANKKPRRSFWPEADFIRKYTDMAEPDHKNSQTLDQVAEVQPAFPRAQFGLPIQFQFKCNRSKRHLDEKHREPYKSELIPADNKNRLASPLILKALAVGSTAKSKWEGRGQAIIAVLKQPKLKQLSLRLVHDGHSSHKRHWKNIQRKLERLSITEEHIYPDYQYLEKYSHRNPLQHGYSTKQLGATEKSSTTSAIEAFLSSKEVIHWWSNRS